MCHFNGPSTPKKTRTLAPRLVVKFLREIPPKQVVEFAGTGEFFMDTNALAHLRKAGELGHRPCVLTNGQLLSPELIDAVLEAGVRRIRMSVDEIDPDRYSCIRKGGDLQNVLDACAYLRSRKAAYPDLRVEINCILFAESFPRQSEFVRFWRGRVDQVNFTGEYYEIFKFRNLFFQPSQRVDCRLAVYLLPSGQMSPCCAISVAQHYCRLDWLPDINVTSPAEGYQMFQDMYGNSESQLRQICKKCQWWILFANENGKSPYWRPVPLDLHVTARLRESLVAVMKHLWVPASFQGQQMRQARNPLVLMERDHQ